MDYDTAIEADVTVRQACRELAKHGVEDIQILPGLIMCFGIPTIDASGNEVPDVGSFAIDTHSHVNGGDVLRWLGY